jgi:hypothetical protein
MSHKKRRMARAEDEHTFLAIRVDQHDARLDASINHDVRQPHLASDLDDEDCPRVALYGAGSAA